MNRIILLTFSLLIGNGIYAQNLKEYKASNGITYKIGDDVIMGIGSGNNDQYVYMWITSALAKGGEIKSRAYNGYPVTIKKIKRFKDKKTEKVLFLVGGGNISNYTLDIENAIESCEIKDCGNNSTKISDKETDKYEKLKKLKELLDSGIITQAEFDSEKKKILESDQ
ncbi:SHOCT domain-containing protein [Gelidibacter sp. F2691]|nr:SHOCT domain-containing protein [Gelidibacter sp. F2691]